MSNQPHSATYLLFANQRVEDTGKDAGVIKVVRLLLQKILLRSKYKLFKTSK